MKEKNLKFLKKSEIYIQNLNLKQEMTVMSYIK